MIVFIQLLHFTAALHSMWGAVKSCSPAVTTACEAVHMLAMAGHREVAQAVPKSNCNARCLRQELTWLARPSC